MNRKMMAKIRNDLKCYLLLLLPIGLFSIFFLYGFFRGFVISLTDYDLRYVFERGINFIGFDNYVKVFKDKFFLSGLLHTFIWTFVMLVGNNFFGLLMAILIKKLKRGKKFFLAGLYWPALVSAAVGTQITLYIFDPTQTGLLNVIMSWFNLPPTDWLNNSQTALLSLMIIPFFTGFCMKMLIYYAGINAIPKSYYEAAALESNNGLKIFIKITLPLLAPIVFFNVLLSIIDGIKIIAPMQLITPENEFTVSVIYALYIEAFTRTNFSYAFSMGFVVFVIIIVLTLIQKLLSREEVVYA